MNLLDDADLAYMRETQAETRPTAAELHPKVDRAPDGLGGSAIAYADDGQPVQVRVVKVNDNTSSDDTLRDLAARYGVTDLRKVILDLVPVSPGDLLHDTDRDRWYELVSGATSEEWTTAHIVWAIRTAKRPAGG